MAGVQGIEGAEGKEVPVLKGSDALPRHRLGSEFDGQCLKRRSNRTFEGKAWLLLKAEAEGLLAEAPPQPSNTYRRAKITAS